MYYTKASTHGISKNKIICTFSRTVPDATDHRSSNVMVGHYTNVLHVQLLGVEHSTNMYTYNKYVIKKQCGV